MIEKIVVETVVGLAWYSTMAGMTHGLGKHFGWWEREQMLGAEANVYNTTAWSAVWPLYLGGRALVWTLSKVFIAPAALATAGEDVVCKLAKMITGKQPALTLQGENFYQTRGTLVSEQEEQSLSRRHNRYSY